jgi:hypothetical protein
MPRGTTNASWFEFMESAIHSGSTVICIARQIVKRNMPDIFAISASRWVAKLEHRFPSDWIAGDVAEDER